MTITAKVVCDSISPQGIRLTTMQLRYPKMIHSEFMTHRVFSRNASSSRAIPVERLIQDVMDDPAMPVFWGKNRPGMQAVEEMTIEERREAINEWLMARDDAVRHARILHMYGTHKQLVNRTIEPWCHINVVVTSTEWANFNALRFHKDAQPEMRVLAEAMRDARQSSTPQEREPGDWHLPYVGHGEVQTHLRGESGMQAWTDEMWTEVAIKISVARCARVSYLTHDGKAPNIEQDLKLYDRLVGSVPLHASPAEHQATPDEAESYTLMTHEPTEEQKRDRIMPMDLALTFKNSHQHGNFVGWRQYRKMLPNENVKDR
jgi:thymidylate synthase ThyX